MASRIVPEGGYRLKPFRTPRKTSPSHLRFIKQLPCICCLTHGIEVQADDPMHLKSGSLVHAKEAAGGSEKSDDRWVLPGCRPHHDKQHTMNEINFWKMYRIDPFLLALILWGLTGDEYAATEVLKLHARGGANVLSR